MMATYMSSPPWGFIFGDIHRLEGRVDGFYLCADKGRSACHLPSTITSLDGMVTWDDGLVQCVMHAKFMHELCSLLTHIPTY
jgi:hypothetical protein